MPSLYLKETHSYLRLLPACSKIARTKVKVGKTRLLSIDKIVEIQFVEMAGAVATKQASVTKLHVSVVWAFLQKKSFSSKTETAQWYSLSLLYFLSVISAFVIYSDVFHRIICWVEKLFIFASVLLDSSKTCYFRTVFSLLLSTILSMSHIYCWQIACLYWFCLSRTGDVYNLSQICRDSEANIWKPA